VRLDAGNRPNLVCNQNGTGVGRTDLFISGDLVPTSYFGGTAQTADTPIFEENWAHLVMVVANTPDGDPATNADYTVRYYFDGQLIGTVAGVNVETATGNWVLGSHKTQISGFLAGLMDEVSFYDYALDDPNGDGDTSDSKIPAHFAAYTAHGAPLLSFGARPISIGPGDTATLHVVVGGSAQSVEIDDGSGTPIPVNPVDGAATIDVTPTATTTYTLKVDDGTTEHTAEATVQVFSGEIKITVVSFDAGEFSMTAEGMIPGKSYDVVYTTDIADWDTVNGAAMLLDTFTADATGTHTLTDLPPDATGFYRVEESPVPAP
jgi:hypothetical protein